MVGCIGGRHGNDIRVGCGVEGRCAVIIAHGGDNDCRRGRLLNRFTQQTRIGITTKRKIDDRCTIGGGIGHRVGNGRVVGNTVGLHGNHRHERTLPAETGHAQTVISGGTGYPSHLGAMIVGGGDIVGLCDKVPAVDIVNLAVLIVVYSVTQHVVILP